VFCDFATADGHACAVKTLGLTGNAELRGDPQARDPDLHDRRRARTLLELNETLIAAFGRTLWPPGHAMCQYADGEGQSTVDQWMTRLRLSDQ